VCVLVCVREDPHLAVVRRGVCMRICGRGCVVASKLQPMGMYTIEMVLVCVFRGSRAYVHVSGMACMCVRVWRTQTLGYNSRSL